MCEKKVPVLNSMIKNRNTRFLKSYTLNYTNTEGNEKLYEMVSNFDYEKPEEIGQNASGVVIVVSVLKEKNISIHGLLNQCPSAVRWGVLYALIFAVILFGAYGPGYDEVAMMYAGF